MRQCQVYQAVYAYNQSQNSLPVIARSAKAYVHGQTNVNDKLKTPNNELDVPISWLTNCSTVGIPEL